ncbi:MAG: putative drug exporters of the superfamily [Streptosporangiaceae bacterium]|nr:putative drug exporters of the superfamily [Streptosporangiaceae bacterium]
MATFLYKLGRLAFRRRWWVALVWVCLLAAVGTGAATASSTTSDSFSIPGTEAQKAFDLLNGRFPGLSADGASARVVFTDPGGQKVTTPQNRAVIERVVGELNRGGQVASVADPFRVKAVSQDGGTAYAQVSYKVQPTELTDATRAALKGAAQDGRDAGLKVEISGTALLVIPTTGVTEVIGIGISALVLVITFGSLIAAGLPLVTALIGVGIGVSAITALSSVLNLSSSTSILAMMIGLAVGIDYALFIVSRYRGELTEGREPEEAAGRAVGTAGSAVVFAGLTVLIALAGLSVVNIPMLTKMGLAAAGTVAIAVLIALTLIPAVLGFAGRRVLGRAARNRAADAQGMPDSKPGLGTRWARFVIRRPIPVLIAGILGLGVMAVPALDLQMGLPDDGAQPTSTTQRRAYDQLSQGFGPGFNGPLMVVVDTAHAGRPKAAAEQVTKTISGLTGVAAATPPIFNRSGDTAVLTVVPTSKPSSVQTEDLVKSIRHEAVGLHERTGATVLVTGQTAMNIDVSGKLNNALVPYLALVVGLAFLLLMIVFRSVLVPLKAALGFLLSVVAALGAVVAVFQWGWLAGLIGVEQSGPIMSMMPIFMIGVVFGLAMDYEVFLVTRMREAYVHGEEPGEAVVTGFTHGGRVVAAAAVIMISVFAGFIGSSESMIKMMGFGLAIAVAFDAFVVRMAIVPAVLGLLGRAAWWLPRWLHKVIPNVDVEGEQLRKRLAPEPIAPAPAPAFEPRPERVRELAAVGARSEPRSYAGQAPDMRPAASTVTTTSGAAAAERAGTEIRGFVRGAENAPARAATLTLITLTGRQVSRATAHADGSYVLATPGAGSYVLISAGDGHQPQAAAITVGDQPLTHNILLAGTSGLVAAVRSSRDGRPLEGALVVVTDVRGEVVASGDTGADGTFAFGGLAGGLFTAAVSATGHRPSAVPVEVAGSGGATRVEVELQPGARLRGAVRAGADGLPLADARVTLIDAAGNMVATATTESDGEYAFTDLDEGQYTVIASGYPPVATALDLSGTGESGFDLRLGHPRE